MANTLYDTLFAPHIGKTDPFLILKSGAQVSYDAFLRVAARFAHTLVEAGVAPGERVVMQVGKSVEALAIYAASTQAGAVFLPLNTAYTPDEVSYFIEDAAPKLVICDEQSKDDLTPIAARANARLLTLNSDGSGDLADLARNQPDLFDTVSRQPDDLAAFLYTSGTTGRSKGAMLSHSNLLSNADVLVDYWRFTETDILLHALPIFHTHGLFVASNISLLAGGQMIFLPGFNVDDIIANLPKATSMMGVPTFYTRLLDDPRLTPSLTNNIRLFVSGSAPLLADTHRAFEARTGHRILERYGMTETNMNTSNPYDGVRRAGTVGLPLPGIDVRITEPETGVELPLGEIGIIEVRGPNVFQGYWQMPEKTAEELREDGFFITGDMGLIDDQGYVQIVGRSKDLIISGGYNIYPKEVELLLDAQNGVQESAVIGVPHPDFGEAIIGVLVPEDAALDTNAILENIKPLIARFKQPKQLLIMSKLPRNTMGKVQKNLLRDRYKDLFASAR